MPDLANLSTRQRSCACATRSGSAGKVDAVSNLSQDVIDLRIETTASETGRDYHRNRRAVELINRQDWGVDR